MLAVSLGFLIAFALIFGSTLLGMFLRSRVPDHHLAGDSKDVIRLATALIATMSAVVLALLFASTRPMRPILGLGITRSVGSPASLIRLKARPSGS